MSATSGFPTGYGQSAFAESSTDVEVHSASDGEQSARKGLEFAFLVLPMIAPSQDRRSKWAFSLVVIVKVALIAAAVVLAFA